MSEIFKEWFHPFHSPSELPWLSGDLNLGLQSPSIHDYTTLSNSDPLLHLPNHDDFLYFASVLLTGEMQRPSLAPAFKLLRVGSLKSRGDFHVCGH